MNLQGQRVSVLGAGKSGIAVARLLAEAGASVLVSDAGAIPSDVVESFRLSGIRCEEGGHSADVYDADWAVVSPGLPPWLPVVEGMVGRSVPLYSEIEVASRFCRARIIGVTGTDGKSTTTTLLHQLFTREGERCGFRSFCVGNIGLPFSASVMQMEPGDVAVVELSSYQLERIEHFHPEVAVITNIAPDHLARYHGNLHEYAAAKFRIHANQGKGDTLVYNGDDQVLQEHFEQHQYPFALLPFSLQSPEQSSFRDRFCFDGTHLVQSHRDGRHEVLLPVDAVLKKSFYGRHNIANVLAAAGVATAAGVHRESLVRALQEFQGIEHRQEFVATVKGVDWINDSKATNLNAMRTALEALSGSVVLIAGGRDKGNDYAAVLALVQEKVTLLIAMGESRERLLQAFCGVVPVREASSLAAAVEIAHACSIPGQTVLFSPGCASFDQFHDFEDRGRQFKHIVDQLPVCP